MGIWDNVKQFVYGPPAAEYLPSLTAAPERRSLGYPVIPNYALTSSSAVEAVRGGVLAHGPGATELYRQAFELGGDSNSLVAICLFRLATDFPQAPMRVYTLGKGDKWDPVADHPLTRLLARPNRHMTGRQLWWHKTYVENIHGNAYWRKIRSGDALTGNVVELWPLSPNACKPIREKGSSNFIDYYRYRYGPGTGDYEDIPVENIVHFRTGLDDRDHRLGISRLRQVLREVTTDEQSTLFVQRLLRNNAVPGLIVTPATDAQMDEETAMIVKARIEAAMTGENVGRTAVLSPGSTAHQFGFDPKSLDLAPLSSLSETRICAIFGIPPQVAGTRSGLSASTFSNYAQAYESYYELTVLPQYDTTADTVNTQLLPDFTSAANQEARFDTSELRALQEDQDALAKRINTLWLSDVFTLDQTLSELSYEPSGTEQGAMRYSQLQALYGAAAAALPSTLTATPTPATRAVHLERKAFGEDAFAEKITAIGDRVREEYEPIIGRYFTSQSKRVVAAVERQEQAG